MLTNPLGMGSGILFSFAPIFVFVIFAVVIGMILVGAIQSIRQWKKNNDSPVLTVDAAVAAKRTHVSHTSHNTGPDSMATTTSSTMYYVTFQVPSGDRMEFYVRGSEYGMLAEGDSGKLTFQGTRYLNFERD